MSGCTVVKEDKGCSPVEGVRGYCHHPQALAQMDMPRPTRERVGWSDRRGPARDGRDVGSLQQSRRRGARSYEWEDQRLRQDQKVTNSQWRILVSLTVADAQLSESVEASEYWYHCGFQRSWDAQDQFFQPKASAEQVAEQVAHECRRTQRGGKAAHGEIHVQCSDMGAVFIWH